MQIITGTFDYWYIIKVRELDNQVDYEFYFEDKLFAAGIATSLISMLELFDSLVQQLTKKSKCP